MAKRGGSSHLKRLAAPRYVPVARKGFVWLARPKPGPHPAEESITLLSLVRDVLGVAEAAREAKRIIRTGAVLVDGRAVKRERFPVGLMDVVSIPATGKNYRVVVDAHGRMKLSEIPAAEATYKLCRVSSKSSVRGNKTQIGLHDGRNLVYGEGVRVGDTVKLAVPAQTVMEVISLAESAHCMVTKGKHAGKLATVSKLHARRSRREAEATLNSGGEEFTTVKKYLFAVGKDFTAA